MASVKWKPFNLGRLSCVLQKHYSLFIMLYFQLSIAQERLCVTFWLRGTVQILV